MVDPAAAVHRLSAQAQADLRSAYDGEVAERLPRLRAALTGQPGDDLARDAHSLASSAWVVGEPDVSRAARELERLLHAGEASRGALARLVGLLV